MQNTLENLSKIYCPNIIFDIGACIGNWTKLAKQFFPNSFYYLFEPIKYDLLNEFNNDINVSVYNSLLFNEEKEVDWFEMKNTGDSIFKENTNVYKDCKSIKKQTTTLNSIFTNKFTNHDDIFIKIDCQGSELPIIQGATHILPYTSFILLELPFFGKYNQNVPSFIESINYMNSIDFIPFDICEKHYMNSFVMQIDMLFIKKNHPLVEFVNKQLL